MCRIALMTFLIPRKPIGFVRTRVYGAGTFCGPQEISYPGFADFLYSRAKILDLYDRDVSDRQKEIVATRFRKRQDSDPSSDSFRALVADQKLQTRYDEHS